MLTRLSVMMFLQYFVQGAYLPVVSVYVRDALGFTNNQIGNGLWPWLGILPVAQQQRHPLIKLISRVINNWHQNLLLG